MSLQRLRRYGNAREDALHDLVGGDVLRESFERENDAVSQDIEREVLDVLTGDVAAAAEDGAIAATLGPGPDPAIDRSRSASWRSADLQSILPVVTALRPSATLRSNDCVRSERSASLDEASMITAVNLSTIA